MSLLIFYLSLALGVSFFCSVLEAVILSITPSFVEALRQKSPKTGTKLRYLKANIDLPLAAILSLNTIAHTVGAAGVGAQAMVVFGDGYIALTSALLTFLILIFSEIIPKTLGALYWKQLVPVTLRILPVLIRALYPLVFLSDKIARWLASDKTVSAVSREEVQAMTELARKSGVFHEQESRILKNLLWVGKLKVKDVMTPRPVMFMLPAGMTVGEVMDQYPEIEFSRIPIYTENPEDTDSFVLRNDIMMEASKNRLDTLLSTLSRTMKIVPDATNLILIFEQFLSEGEHIAMVVNEYGGIEGIVTMEDVVETLLGIEIVDETDVTIDMQAMARQQWRKRARALELIHSEEKDASPK
ncbi:MAG: hemolysin family protein [Desulfatiglandaceae bacterium]